MELIRAGPEGQVNEVEGTSDRTWDQRDETCDDADEEECKGEFEGEFEGEEEGEEDVEEGRTVLNGHDVMLF